MAPRTLQKDLSLDTLWSEMTYTYARLSANPKASDLAPTVQPLIAEVEETRVGQRRTWGKEIEAQALCDAVNLELDDLVVEIADNLLFIIKDRRSPRVTRYLQQSPYAIVRMALRSEVETVRSWPESLKTEPEEALSAFGPRLEALIAKADAALAAHRTAESARTDYRVRVINPLIDKLNDARLKLYAQLVTRAEEQKLGKYWADAFFKTSSRRTSDEPGDPVVADAG